MEREIKEFVLENESGKENGIIKFNGDYYQFSIVKDNVNIRPLERDIYHLFFKTIAFEQLSLFIKTLEGFIHNTNGKLTPIFSRIGLIHPKIIEASNIEELRGVDRIFDRLLNSLKDFTKIYENMGFFLSAYHTEQSSPINIKNFTEGYYHCVITDREIKHKVVFNIDIDEKINLNIVGKELLKAFFFTGEAIFTTVRGKEKTIELKIIVDKAENTKIGFLFPNHLIELKEKENLNSSQLKSLSFLNLVEEIATTNKWIFKNSEEGIFLEL